MSPVARTVCLLAALSSAACGSRGGGAPAADDDDEAPAPAAADVPGVAASKGGSAPGGPVVELESDHGHSHDYVPCPVPARVRRDPDRLLDQAAHSYDAGEFAAAFSCAEAAADAMPQAVEAHHLRAASLAALGRHDSAQVAFTMALALDPDDPETLSAAADFYINVLPPKRRETTLVGLEYARRGRNRAVTRRARNKPLRARLALLEAQALNDLGRADEAIPRVEDALKLAPGMLEAKHELGVSLFNLCRFDDAQQAFAAVLRLSPEDAYAHHHLGLIYERIGRDADADAHFARARELSPDEFWTPVLLEPAAFEAELAAAVAELPPESFALLAGVTVEVVDLPALDDLTAVDPPFSPTILGLFRGLPKGVEPPPGERAAVPPRAIVLYRKNLARAVKDREELDGQIRRTLIHEIGHLSGLDEDDLRRRGLD